MTRFLAHALFALFVLLALSTHSNHWRVGPFTWGSLQSLFLPVSLPLDLGVLSLVPVLAVVSWATYRLRQRPARPWQWGRWSMTAPLLGLTLLVVASLDPAPTLRTSVRLVMVGLTWWVYLFVLNERPDLVVPFALVAAVQGGVAIGQFLRQGDLGLAALGERSQDPALSGVTVVLVDDRRWLRAYGLTGHPNALGVTLTVALLILLPAFTRTRGWRQVGVGVSAILGGLGLLVSFSRTAWVAFAVGIAVWAMWARVARGEAPRDPRETLAAVRGLAMAFLGLILAFVLLYKDLVISRFLHLNTYIEGRSLAERREDARIAWTIVKQHPWRGVGVGNYRAAARLQQPGARTVHSVPLLVAAELGLPGLVLWLWLLLSPLFLLFRSSAPVLPSTAACLVPWLAVILMSTFDYTLWPFATMRGAILLPLLAARLSQV